MRTARCGNMSAPPSVSDQLINLTPTIVAAIVLTTAQPIIPRTTAIFAILNFPGLRIANLRWEIWADREIVKVTLAIAGTVNDNADNPPTNIKPDVIDRDEMVSVSAVCRCYSR